jgi:hypothetical protein
LDIYLFFIVVLSYYLLSLNDSLPPSLSLSLSLALNRPTLPPASASGAHSGDEEVDGWNGKAGMDYLDHILDTMLAEGGGRGGGGEGGRGGGGGGGGSDISKSSELESFTSM